MAKVKFLRRNWNRHSKLGKRRKNKQVWRKPKGRHNKMREKQRGYAAVVNVGYRTNKKGRGLLEGKIPVMVMNTSDLENVGKNQIAIIGKVGIKKKLEIARKALEKKIMLHNMNAKKFTKLNSKEKGKDANKAGDKK